MFLPSLLKKRFIYKGAKIFLRYFGKNLTSYQKIAVAGILSELEQAYCTKRPVIFTSAFVPTEMVYGLGAVPFLPEVWSGFAAAFGLSDMAISASEALGYSQDLCSFHRCNLGLGQMKLLPKPSAVIVTSQLCDGGKSSLYYHSRVGRCPFYVLDVPYSNTPEAQSWLCQQIKEVVADLTRRVPGLSVRFMKRAIENSNGARRSYLNLCKLRKHSPSPWSGSEALNYVAVFLSSWGSSWLSAFYEELRSCLERNISEHRFCVPNERHRLLWLNLKPYYKTGIFDFLEKRSQISIAFEEYNYLYWQELDSNQWAQSLARKMLSNFGWGPIERKLEALWSMIKEYRIDGVVQFAQWGCRQSNGSARILAEFLRKRGIPFLELDGDGVDPGNSGSAQMLTRLSAFLEVLDSKHQSLPGGQDQGTLLEEGGLEWSRQA